MSVETHGLGVVGRSVSSESDSLRHATCAWGLLCVFGAIGAWTLRHDTAVTLTFAVVMTLVGLSFIMYAFYEWSGVIVPSVVFAGLSAFRAFNVGIEPAFLKSMYPYGWLTVLFLSFVLLVVSVRRANT